MTTGDASFTQAVRRLYVPSMGTETVARMLETLVRFTRPARVLEVGMGYTTPFLAATLADLRDQAREESAALANKTGEFLAAGECLGENWLNADPALLAPDFYVTEYAPRMVAVDNLSIPESSAVRVRGVLTELGLDDLVTVVNSDLRTAKDKLPGWLTPIDFAWVDAWECLYFFETFWELMNPAGGLLVMHYLMTYPEGEAVLDYLRLMQKLQPGEFEIINLVEQHKLTQNSVTMVRRTSAGKPEPYAEEGGDFRWAELIQPAAVRQRAAEASRRSGAPDDSPGS
jgi:predicted O-methyltransferase YrrM